MSFSSTRLINSIKHEHSYKILYLNLHTDRYFCQPTVNVFLYGNTDLTDGENAELFSAVQDYILKTKRFC